MDVAFLVPEAKQTMTSSIARVLMWQLLVGLGLAAVLWSLFGTVAGYSALLGSLVCVLPNAFLGLRLVVPCRDPGALKRAAWIGELGKLALTVLLFTLVFTSVKPLTAAALFAGFIASQLAVFSGFLIRGDTNRTAGNTNGS